MNIASTTSTIEGIIPYVILAGVVAFILSRLAAGPLADLLSHARKRKDELDILPMPEGRGFPPSREGFPASLGLPHSGSYGPSTGMLPVAHRPSHRGFGGKQSILQQSILQKSGAALHPPSSSQGSSRRNSDKVRRSGRFGCAGRPR